MSYPTKRFDYSPLARAGFAGYLLIAVSALLPGAPAFAQDGEPRESNTQTHSGTLLSVDESKLTITPDGQKEQTHQIVRDATISLNGEPASTDDLRQGDQVRVVTPPDGKAALAIEAIRVEPRTTAIGPRAVVAQVFDRDVVEGDAPPAPRGPREDREDNAPAERDGPVAAADDNPRIAGDNRVKRGMLGLFVGPGDFDAPGLRVVEVMADGPAARAGIREGDLLLSFNQQQLVEPQRLGELVERVGAGERVELIVVRNGRRFKASPTLAEGEDFAEGNLRGGEANHHPDQACMGVSIDEDAATGENAPRGALVKRVYPASPAWRAGIRDDDRITAIDGEPINEAQQLYAALDGFKPGTEVKVDIVREGVDKPTTLDVALARHADVFASHQDDSAENYDPIYDIPETAMRMEYERRLEEHDERIEGLMLQMLKELRELRHEVDAMKGGKAPAIGTEDR